MAAMGAPGVRLITAASDGNKKGVKKWLDQGVDVDSRDWDNLTPLIAASSQGHLVRPVAVLQGCYFVPHVGYVAPREAQSAGLGLVRGIYWLVVGLPSLTKNDTVS